MSGPLDLGQRLVVIFFGLCSVLGLLNVGLDVFARSKWSLVFAAAQGFFAIFAASAAWLIHKWKVAGWMMGMLIVLQSFSNLANSRVGLGPSWLTVALLVPMAVVGVWLWLPDVRAKFGLKKVFS